MSALCGQAIEMVEMVSESMRSDLIPGPRPSHTDFIWAVTRPTMFAILSVVCRILLQLVLSKAGSFV